MFQGVVNYILGYQSKTRHYTIVTYNNHTTLPIQQLQTTTAKPHKRSIHQHTNQNNRIIHDNTLAVPTTNLHKSSMCKPLHHRTNLEVQNNTKTHTEVDNSRHHPFHHTDPHYMITF